MKITWAIARLVLIQAFRRKAVLMVGALFLLSLPLLLIKVDPEAGGSGRRLHIEADGTQEGEIKILLTYTLTIGGGLLLALTLFVSCSTLDEEIVQKQIFLVAAKPVPRWRILLGKWAGVVLLDAWLLAVMGTVVLIVVAYFARFDPSRPEGYLAVREQVLASRRSIRPPDLDLERAVQRERRRLLDQGLTAKELEEARIETVLSSQLEKKYARVNPLGVTMFFLDDVPVPDDPESKHLTIRYKLHAMQGGEVPLYGEWLIGRPDGEYGYRRITKSRAGDAREFQVPAEVVGPDGIVLIQFRNLTVGDPRSPDEKLRRPHAVSFNMKDGLEVLAPVSSGVGGFLASLIPLEGVQHLVRTLPFLTNFGRGLLMILIRLALVALVGVAASAELQFSVALLVAFFVVYLGFAREFYIGILAKSNMPTAASMEELDFEAGEVAKDTGSWLYRTVGRPVSHAALRVFTFFSPSFAQTDPTEDLAVGRTIRWRRVAWQAFLDIGLRGGAALLIGCWLLRRRELARPQF